MKSLVERNPVKSLVLVLLLCSLIGVAFAHNTMRSATVRYLKVLTSYTSTGTLTVGTDGSGKDVTFYSDTAGDNFLWDSSAEALKITGTNGQDALDVDDGNVDIADDLDVDGTSNLDIVDIDGAVQIDGATTYGVDGTGVDVIFYSSTSGDSAVWDTSDEAFKIEGTAGQDALLVSDGNVSVTNDVDISGVLTTDGINSSAIVVTDAASYSVLAANTGMLHVIGDNSQATSILLPAVAAGLNYEFWYIGGAAEAHDDTLDTQADANFFIGGVSFLDIDAGDAADEVHVGLYSNGSSNSKLTLVNMSAGTRIKVSCDGTNWYLTGQILSDTVPAFGDQ